ncbi:MAG: hypothetical protein JRH11_13055 [Deltaproteobacteria bacterium]|nr:hypothetical protein [Deltaproteobacteria bacterium]
MSDITAGSAAASELKRAWAVAGVLLVLLLTVAWFVELSRDTRVLVDGPLALPSMPASEARLSEDGLVDNAVMLTPAFTIEAPTTLTMTLRRDASEGWVGVNLALIEETTGEIRQLGLGTEVRQTVGADLEAQRESTVLVDRVAAGRYVVRVAPGWEPLGQVGTAGASDQDEGPRIALSPPAASLRIVEGRSSHWGLAFAALMLLLPALVMSIRSALSRRAAGGAAKTTASTAPQADQSGETGDGTLDS